MLGLTCYRQYLVTSCVVQDHNQGPCATWDICQKRILNSNHAKSRLPIDYFIFGQSFWNWNYIAQQWYWRALCKIRKKKFWKPKGMLWTNEVLRDLSLRWVSDGYPPTLHSPIEARLLAILCHASQTMCDWDLCSWGVFSITTAVEYEVLRNFWEISKVNITYINFTYINNRTVIFIHALHTPMSSRCIPTCNSIS